jgi:hypothetical protein
MRPAEGAGVLIVSDFHCGVNALPFALHISQIVNYP